MPFINGRYYVNPIMGEALEAAREAEAALAALEDRARQGAGAEGAGATGGGSDDGFGGASAQPAGHAEGPIHRVEIEAAELVPANSGRAARGYVARVHRHASPGSGRTGDAPSHAETHVFADHRDLVGFLRDELAKDGESQRHRS